MRFDELNENNYMMFAVKMYDNPHALTKEEFEDDLKRIKYGGVEGVGAIEFLNLLRDGSLTKHESVTRCRRKLQAQHPELRDEAVYKGRKTVEKQMKDTRSYW